SGRSTDSGNSSRRIFSQTCFEAAQELGPRDFSGAQSQQVLAGDLAIDEVDPFGIEVLGQSRQGDLRGVSLVIKHRFPAETAANPNTVDSPYQPALPPGLHALRIAQFMEPDIGALHFGSDPGAVLVGARGLRAGP